MNQLKWCCLLDVRCMWNVTSQIYTTLLCKSKPPCKRTFNTEKKSICVLFCRKQYKDSKRFKVCMSWSFFFFPMIAKVPSEKILRAGKILRNTILSRAPHMIRDRKYHLKTYRCVSWLYRGLWIFMPAILWCVIYALPYLQVSKGLKLFCDAIWVECYAVFNGPGKSFLK